MLSRVPSLLCALVLLAGGTACAPAASQTTGTTATSQAARSTSVVQPPHNDTRTPFNLVSVPALTEHEYDGRSFRLDRVIAEDLSHTRYAISYRSGDLRITGVMNVPNRPGRHPVVVIAHGYHEPGDYTSGSDMLREQVYLVERGYVVLQPDYRNYGGSGQEPGHAVARPLGYPEDLVNAVRALERADLPFTDTDRTGIFGRSMGGGVTLNALAANPDLVDAAVLYAPVSSRAEDNFDRWVRTDPEYRDLEERVVATYGSPETDPGFWQEASSAGYLDRLDVPLQVHHGTADVVCPVTWSRATARTVEQTGGDVELFEYPGQGHRFDSAWTTLMRRTARFFDTHL